MKLYSLVLVAVLASTIGCNAKQHAEDLGFKQGDDLVEAAHQVIGKCGPVKKSRF